MKKNILVLLPLAILLTVACGKEETDYRSSWVGEYDYVKVYRWWSRAGSRTSETAGRLEVRAVDSCCVRMQLQTDSTKYWICRVSRDGVLTLVEPSIYRRFAGSFVASDSLIFECGNFSPGANANSYYRCRRVVGG